MSMKRPASPDPIASEVEIFTSSPIVDRQSTFIAYYSPTVAPKTLQRLSEAKAASHRILAWRIPSKQRTLTPGRPIYETGHDDDGEQWAGRKLESLMEQLGVQGAIVVARWYGGVLLGPVRFKHIEDCAKEAISLFRNPRGGNKKQRVDAQAVGQLAPQPSAPVPVMRPEEVQRRKADLVRTLQRRDESISALRLLLEQKKAAEFGTNSSTSSEQPSASSPARKLDYDHMPLARIQALENARDASIAFLLEEIDRVEKEQAQREVEEAVNKQKIKAQRAAIDEEEADEAWAALAAHMLKQADADKSSPKSPQE